MEIIKYYYYYSKRLSESKDEKFVSNLLCHRFNSILRLLQPKIKDTILNMFLVEKEEHDAPSFWINPDIHDFYKFTKNDFRLDGYKYSDFDHKIPVAI